MRMPGVPGMGGMNMNQLMNQMGGMPGMGGGMSDDGEAHADERAVQAEVTSFSSTRSAPGIIYATECGCASLHKNTPSVYKAGLLLPCMDVFNCVWKERAVSKADKLFVSMCRDILDHGTTTEGEKVRPVWEDGTPAYTIKNFGVTNRYDLREEFPALTLRRTALKSAMDEVLWIYQKKSNNINDLKSHIWDQWADETGSIGKAYGYQIAQKSHYKEGDFDQMDRALYDLTHTPYSRRIMTNMYTFADLSEMHLYPCAYSVTYNVTAEPGCDKPVLNMVLMQRSQDILAANNWNVCQYAILLMMVARHCDMIAGELLHVIVDAHIYDRHVDIVRELIERPQFPAPKVSLNPEVTNFYDFTTDDLIVEDYETGPQVKGIPIAV